MGLIARVRGCPHPFSLCARPSLCVRACLCGVCAAAILAFLSLWPAGSAPTRSVESPFLQIQRQLERTNIDRTLSDGGATAGAGYDAILSGAVKLRVAIIVLSCRSDACNSKRALFRDTVFRPFQQQLDAAALVRTATDPLYCSPWKPSGATIRWDWFRERVELRHLFALGGDGASLKDITTLGQERREFGDVLLVPGGDEYAGIMHRVLRVLAAIGVHAAIARSSNAVVNISVKSDGVGALPLIPFPQGFDPDFVMKIDDDTFPRLPQLAAAMYELVHAASLAAADRASGLRLVGDRALRHESPWALKATKATPGVAIPTQPAPELYWGSFLEACGGVNGFTFAGGNGYALSRGLVAAIARRLEGQLPLGGAAAAEVDAVFQWPVRVRAGHDLPLFVPGEDVGVGVLLRSHAHARVHDPRLQDVPAAGPPNGRPVTPQSLVVHKARTGAAWVALGSYFAGANDCGALPLALP